MQLLKEWVHNFCKSLYFDYNIFAGHVKELKKGQKKLHNSVD